MSCSKIPVVARVIASDFGARPILGELLYQTLSQLGAYNYQSISAARRVGLTTRD